MKTEIERCRKYFSTLNDNQFQLWLFIVVVIAGNGLPNPNIRHLNVFRCFHMANVLKAKLSNLAQREGASIRYLSCASFSVLFCCLLQTFAQFIGIGGGGGGGDDDGGVVMQDPLLKRNTDTVTE